MNSDSTSGSPHDIRDRTLEFAVRAIELFRVLQTDTDRAAWIVGRQFVRSATSVGANLAEAQAGESKRDFVHKLQISLKEARETLYWLSIMDRTSMLPTERLTPITQETNEIIAILVTIIRKTKAGAR